MSYRIEKGVPMPERFPGRTYPFAEMQDGDSFLIPMDGRKARLVQMLAYQAARRAGVQITTRSEPGGLRVWRKGHAPPRTPAQRRVFDPARAEVMVERHLRGETMEAIGAGFGVTRERVRQIIRKVGVSVQDTAHAHGKDFVPWTCPVCGQVKQIKERKIAGKQWCSAVCASKARAKWTDATIVAKLQEIAAQLGRTPTHTEIVRAGGPYITTMHHVFGSMRAAIEAAGLTPRSPGHKLSEEPTA